MEMENFKRLGGGQNLIYNIGEVMTTRKMMETDQKKKKHRTMGSTLNKLRNEKGKK